MTDNGNSQEPRHPIRVVSLRTGLSAHALRAWERRYGVVEPHRSESGQRLYTDADIARLKLLRDAVANGRSISQVAELPDAELAELIAQDRRSAEAAPGASRRAVRQPGETEVSRFVRSALQAAELLDDEVLHRSLLRAMVSVGPMELIDGVIGPLLREVGERWHAGELGAAHEHMVTVAVRRVLSLLLTVFETTPSAPVLIATTVAGEAHELGALQASVLAAEAGWRVIYLGPSLPADDVARVAERRDAAMVAVGAVGDRGEDALVAEVRALRSRLEPGVRLVVGGPAADRYTTALSALEGVEVLDLRELRARLPRHASEAGG